MRLERWALVAALGGSVASCGGQVVQSETLAEHGPAFADVTRAEWQRLGSRRIFFGHQSVGGNLMDGVRAVLADHPEIPLRVVETADPSAAAGPGLSHARIGRNGAPQTKTDAFATIVRGGVGDSGVAMLKYCYVDITGASDPQAMFAAYREAIDGIRVAQPGLTIVHFTLPLKTVEGRWEHFKAKLRGRTTERDLNRIRHRYNGLLRATYAGREPVFDLARLESTRADGSRSFFRSGADSVDIMAPEWTGDGGHLNAAAQRRAAERFLVMLAKL